MIRPKPGSEAYNILACIVRNEAITSADVAEILYPFPRGAAPRSLVELREWVKARKKRTSAVIGRLTSAGYVAPVQDIRLAPWILERFGSVEEAVRTLLRAGVEEEEDGEEEENTGGDEQAEEAEETADLPEGPRLRPILADGPIPDWIPDFGPPLPPVPLRPALPQDPAPPPPCSRALAMVRRVQDSPCSASELLGPKPCGYDSDVLARLFDAGFFEGGRLRTATEKGRALVGGGA